MLHQPGVALTHLDLTLSPDPEGGLEGALAWGHLPPSHHHIATMAAVAIPATLLGIGAVAAGIIRLFLRGQWDGLDGAVSNTSRIIAGRPLAGTHARIPSLNLLSAACSWMHLMAGSIMLPTCSCKGGGD
jgi:hypothetical protein